MSQANNANKATKTAATANHQDVKQFVTFFIGDILLGIDIAHVQEINPQLDVTQVPGASAMILGVVNLRGDVVTVLDPHRMLGLPPRTEVASTQRNLVLNIGGERIGVLVDRVADILTVRANELSQRPANVRSIDRKLIDAVLLRSDELVVLLNPKNLLEVVEQATDGAKAIA